MDSKKQSAKNKRRERHSHAGAGDGSGWPVLVVPDGAGRCLIRGCVGRAEALRILQGRQADDVLVIQVGGVRIEISFHDSIEAADAALKDATVRGVLTGAPAKGRA